MLHSTVCGTVVLGIHTALGSHLVSIGATNLDGIVLALRHKGKPLDGEEPIAGMAGHPTDIGGSHGLHGFVVGPILGDYLAGLPKTAKKLVVGVFVKVVVSMNANIATWHYKPLDTL